MCHLVQAIANASKVPGTFVPDLTESEVPDEYERQFDEDEELEQLLAGTICFKMYPFSSGMCKCNRGSHFKKPKIQSYVDTGILQTRPMHKGK